MCQAGVDAAIALAKARVAAREKYTVRRPDPAAEAQCASYYLQEKYSSSSGSSNREELESAANSLELHSVGKEYSRESFRSVERSEFNPKTRDIARLLDRAMTNHYKAVEDDEFDLKILSNCLSLFERDYKCELLENIGGALSWNYPVRIIIPIQCYTAPSGVIDGPIIRKGKEFEEYCQMSKQAAIARCRNRFPVPVILVEGHYICRSGTLAVRKGVAFGAMTQPDEAPAGQEVFDNPFAYLWDGIKNVAQKGVRTIHRIRNAVKVLLATEMDDIKDLDVKVLKRLKIYVIADLMVENRKIHTGLSVGSSEKINMKIYGSFTTLSIPYPGCEFFRKYSDNKRKAEGLVYDWSKPEVTTVLGMAHEEDDIPLEAIPWEEYREWDLPTLTTNYLRVILEFGFWRGIGVLVHCISGWDRTPLFISLLRLILWADGFVHQSLDAVEITYLTIAYDWYLFGHDLPSRLKKKEEIMHFCFNFITELTGDAFRYRRFNTNQQSNAHNKIRVQKLLDVQHIFMSYYHEKLKH